MFERKLYKALCGGALIAATATASAATIGLVAPLSGPQALVGQDQVDGFMLVLAYIEGGEQAAVACIPAIKAQVFATEDFKEGIQSFVERRKARFAGR